MSAVSIGIFLRPLANGTLDREGIRNYVSAVEAAGARAELVAWRNTPPDDVLSKLDGLLVPGGAEVDPALYGESRKCEQTENFSPQFDRFVVGCLRRAYAQRMPVLGICRGQQIMNVAAGGTLIQSINKFMKRPPTLRIEHRQQTINGMEHEMGPSHTVRVEPHIEGRGTALYRLYAETSLSVNSFHRQAISGVAPIFAAVAWAPDGVVEAIERKDCPQQWGVQWHPEKQRLVDPSSNRIFDKLVADAREWPSI